MKKKILFVIHTLGGGGAEKVLVNLANNIDKKKYDVTVMTLIDIGKLRYDLGDDITYKTTIKLPRKENSTSSGSLLNKTSFKKKILEKIYVLLMKIMPFKLMWKIFVKEKYDIEIAFLEGICAKFVAASNNKKAKKYAWIHVDLINQNRSDKVFINWKQARKIYSKFDKIIAVSNVVKEQFIKKYNFNSNKIAVKYNAILKDDIIKKSKEELDYKFDSNYFYICSVGRLNDQKAYDRLLIIHKRLLDDKYKIKTIIIGEGPNEKSLIDYINKNNLNDSIDLLGFKSNPYPYMKKSNLFVCSSLAEGYSTVICESIILNLPIVTTNCSGMKELLGNNNEYGIVTTNDEEDLYKGIKKILDDERLCKNYQKKLKNRALMFDIITQVEEVEKLFS